MRPVRKERKFEDAYCLITKSLLSINDAAELYESDFQLFVSKYKSNFVCPECRKARVAYANATRPYFKAYPKSSHDEKCTLQQDILPPQKVSEFIDSKDNRAQLDRQMNGLLALLFSSSQEGAFRVQEDTPHSEVHTKSQISRHTIANINLPRKRIDTPFSREDLKSFKLFYGKVLLKWTTIGLEKFAIILSDIKSGAELCEIQITPKVYSYMPDYYKIPVEYICAISFLAELERGENGILSTSLRKSYFLKIQKIDPFLMLR